MNANFNKEFKDFSERLKVYKELSTKLKSCNTPVKKLNP